MSSLSDKILNVLHKKKLSIFIPYCVNDRFHLDNCLVHLKNNYAEFEIILLKTIPSEVTELNQVEMAVDGLDIKFYEYQYKQNKEYDYSSSDFSFSAFKNKAFELCKSEYILFLDSDEIIYLDTDFLHWFLNSDIDKNIGAFKIGVFLYAQSENDKYVFTMQNRIIKNSRIRFNNLVHESIDKSLEHHNLISVETNNMIIHRGYYNPEVHEHKTKRNLGLMAKELYNDIDNLEIVNKLIDTLQYYVYTLGTEMKFKDNLNIANINSLCQNYGVELSINIEKMLNEISHTLQRIASHNYSKDDLMKCYELLNILKTSYEFN